MNKTNVEQQHLKKIGDLFDPHALGLLVFVLMHIPYAFLLQAVPIIAIVQAWLIFGFGYVTALFSDKNDPRPVYIMGYLVGLEVFWRMSSMSPEIPWFAGTYTVIIFSCIGLLRRYERIQDWPAIPLFFLYSLLPSMILITGESPNFIRNTILESLAGPIALGLCCMYLYKFPFSHKQLRFFAFLSIASVIMVWAVSVQSTLTEDVYFGRSSNFEITAGFGPNQVANTLAIGSLLCVLVMVTITNSFFTRIILLIGAVAFCTITLLSFSRGGFIAFLLSTLAIIFVLFIYNTSVANRMITFSIIGIGGISLILTWDFLVGFTEGKLEDRYFNGTDSRRIDILSGEIDIWLNNVILGVGPGKSAGLEEIQFKRSHTEFTRLLAEHGIFGLVANILLILGFAHRYKHANAKGKIWVSSLMVFTLLYLLQAATRTVLPIVTYGIIWMDLFPEEQV